MMQGMFSKKPFAPFRRLQWKLTFSYTLVTVGTLLVIEILVIVLLILLFASDIFTDIVQDSMRISVAAEAESFLAPTPPDIEGLNLWAHSLVDRTFPVNLSGEREEKVTLKFGNVSLETDERQQLYFMDTDLNVLVQVPGPADPDVLNNHFDTAVLPDSEWLLNNALHNVNNPEAYRARHKDGTYIMTAPILADNGEVLGVVLLTYVIPLFDAGTFLPVLQILLVTIFPLLIGAGLIGTLFGFLTARGLVKRLQAMSTAANAWSRGDFSVVTHDQSGDELGQLNRNLNRMAEQLQNLMQTRQDLATLEERNRLARELHDTVKQNLFAAVMQLGAAETLVDTDPAAAKAHLVEAEQLARQSRQELTGLIHELRPIALEDRGLAAALQDYAADWSRRTLIQVNWVVQAERPLPLVVEQELYRVAQEALANIARHSGASSVMIQLSWQETAVQLRIEDDGQGFDTAVAAPKGFGLQTMAERTSQVGGSLNIDSRPGQGTIIRVSIPLDTQEAGQLYE